MVRPSKKNGGLEVAKGGSEMGRNRRGQPLTTRDHNVEPVSYTHLDVYKRQVVVRATVRGNMSPTFTASSVHYQH